MERLGQLNSHLRQERMTVFENVPLAPPDPIFHLTASYVKDSDSDKINLGVGAYRDDSGKPWVLPVVKKAEHAIVSNLALDHEYLPIDGLKTFTEASAKLILGRESPAIIDKRFAACQTISGTGAVRLGAEFISRFFKAPVYISKPTWANHRAIFNEAGLEVFEYQYWDPKSKGLAFDAMIQTFKVQLYKSKRKSAPNCSIILLHSCAHNPTGVDPTPEQWAEIAAVIREKNHFPFFDSAYQGFASGNLDKDAFAVRYFVQQGLDLFVAQSYAKNFGLYGERAGCLTVVAQSQKQAEHISSQLCKIVRPMMSNPPAFGARIVSLVLNSPDLYQEWVDQLKMMANRIIEMRKQLFNALTELQTPGTWNHITDQIGMFSFTGLNENQVKVLKEKYHTYMTDNGRISMAGLNSANVKRFAQSVDWVVRNV